MRADAPATRRSHHAASSTPPATHHPSIAAITGLASCRRVGPERSAVAQPRQVAQVGAGRERLLVAGQHRHAQRVVGVEGQERRRGAARPSRCSRRCARAPGRSAPPPRRRAAPRSSGERSAVSRLRYRRRRCGSSRGRRGAASSSPRRARPPGPRPIGCARPPSTPSAASASCRRRPCSTCSPGAARWASRRCHGARPGSPSSTTDIAARRAIEANLAACGLTDAAEVVAAPAERFLAGAGQQRRWDLALLDPPYDYDGWPELLLDLPAQHRRARGSEGRRAAVRVGGGARQALRPHPRGDRPADHRLTL